MGVIAMNAAQTTFLLGAGASVATGLPTAYALIDELADNLIQRDWARTEIKRLARGDRIDKRDECDYIRFETFLYWIKDVYKDITFFDFLEKYTKPSALQNCVVKMASLGSIILTPNFDDLLEQGFYGIGINPRTIDANNTSDATRVSDIGDVIKLHGSWNFHEDGTILKSSTPLHATMDVIIRNSPGNMLKPEARDLLKNVVDYRTLVVIGYSASDALDIVPALFDCHPNEVFWLDYQNTSATQTTYGEYFSSIVGRGLLPWEDLLCAWQNKGGAISILRGRAEESLELMGLPITGSVSVWDNTSWKKSIKSWAKKVRRHDPSGLGLSSELFGELSLLDKSHQAMKESRGKKDGRCGWSSARRLYELGENKFLVGGCDFADVIKDAKRAQREAQRIADHYAFNNALTLEGRCLSCMNAYAEAIKLFSSSKFIRTDKKYNGRHNGYCTSWVGRSYLWWGKPRKAIPYLEKACDRLIESGDIDNLLDAQFALAVSKMDIGEFADARSTLLKNEETCRLHGLLTQRCYALVELAHVESLLGDFSNLENCMKLPLTFFCASGHDETSEVYEMYADALLLKGEYANALCYFDKANRSLSVLTAKTSTEIDAKAALCKKMVEPDYIKATLDLSLIDMENYGYYSLLIEKAIEHAQGGFTKTQFDGLVSYSRLDSPRTVELAILLARLIPGGTRKIRHLTQKALIILHRNGIHFWDAILT